MRSATANCERSRVWFGVAGSGIDKSHDNSEPWDPSGIQIETREADFAGNIFESKMDLDPSGIAPNPCIAPAHPIDQCLIGAVGERETIA
jgi:hypothetical protein